MIVDLDDEGLREHFWWLTKRWRCGHCGVPVRFQTRDMRDGSWKVIDERTIQSRCGMCGHARAKFTEIVDGADVYQVQPSLSQGRDVADTEGTDLQDVSGDEA